MAKPLSDSTPKVGSLWEHVDSPGLRWQVLSIEGIREVDGTYITLTKLDAADVNEQIPVGAITLSLDIGSFLECFRDEFEDLRLTKWERLLLDEIC
jgi:hypothetical protein